MELPEHYRPRNVSYRRCSPGVDLPAWFLGAIREIDPGLYPVWHTYETLWDSIINEYEGPEEDPRFSIRSHGSDLDWGWVLRNPDGSPREDGRWHIWRLSHPYGWAHISPIDTKDGDYLQLIVDRLNLQRRVTDKYNLNKYKAVLEEQREAEQERKRIAHTNLFDDVHRENRWLLRRAMESAERGQIMPTNPVKETISSYSGQSYRSRLSRPLEDTEGGLVIPEKW